MFVITAARVLSYAGVRSKRTLPEGNAMKLYNANLSPNAFRVRVVANGTRHRARGHRGRLPQGRAQERVVPGHQSERQGAGARGWRFRALGEPRHQRLPRRPEARARPLSGRPEAARDGRPVVLLAGRASRPGRCSGSFSSGYLKPKFGMGETDETAIEPQLKELAQFLPVLDAESRRKRVGRGRPQPRRLRAGKHVHLPEARRRLARRGSQHRRPG